MQVAIAARLGQSQAKQLILPSSGFGAKLLSRCSVMIAKATIGSKSLYSDSSSTWVSLHYSATSGQSSTPTSKVDADLRASDGSGDGHDLVADRRPKVSNTGGTRDQRRSAKDWIVPPTIMPARL